MMQTILPREITFFRAIDPFGDTLWHVRGGCPAFQDRAQKAAFKHRTADLREWPIGGVANVHPPCAAAIDRELEREGRSHAHVS